MECFINFACYGGRLHGDQAGSVDRRHNVFGTRLLEPDGDRATAERRAMLEEPYVLGQARRAVVLPQSAGIAFTVAGFCWRAFTIHAYASRDLNRLGSDRSTQS